MRRLREGGRIRRGERPWPAAHGRVCRSARPSPRVRVVSVHDRRRRARRRDGLALPHPTSHGRAFASFLCTIAAGVRGGGTGWRFPTPHPMAARSRRFCARSPQACGGCGTGRRFFTPHPMAARSHRFCARSPQTCAAEGRAGASSPHIPRPRVRSVPVHGRRGVRSSGRGRARRRDGPALLHPTSPGRAFASFLCTIAAGVRSSGRGRSRRSNSYRAQGGFAPTAAVRRRRAPLRSRSAPRAGRGPRGRSGRRPRSAGRWGGAGRASR